MGMTVRLTPDMLAQFQHAAHPDVGAIHRHQRHAWSPIAGNIASCVSIHSSAAASPRPIPQHDGGQGSATVSR
jgi:hypothetical protein